MGQPSKKHKVGDIPNKWIIKRISKAISTKPYTMEKDPPRTDLDTHANMMVFGKDCYVFDSVFEKTSDVEPFDPSLGVSSSVPIVDAALAYD